MAQESSWGKNDASLNIPAHQLTEDKAQEQEDMSYEESGIFQKKCFCTWGSHITTLSPDTWNGVMYFASTDTEVHRYAKKHHSPRGPGRWGKGRTFSEKAARAVRDHTTPTEFSATFQHHTTPPKSGRGRIRREKVHLNSAGTRAWSMEKNPWACLMHIPKVSSGQGSVCFQKQFSRHQRPSRHFHPEARLLQWTLSHFPASHLRAGVEHTVCAVPPPRLPWRGGFHARSVFQRPFLKPRAALNASRFWKILAGD